MKIMVMSKAVAGASREDLRTHALAESRAVWNLYEQGIVLRMLYRGKPRCLQKRPRLKSQALLSENTCETNACSQPSSHRSAHYVHRRARKIAQVGPTILSENAL